MANVLRFTTHCVAEQIEPQYAAALSKSENYKYEVNTDDPDDVIVHGRARCDCDFARSMRLPCRHTIAYRQLSRSTVPVIPWCCTDER
ncbi:hypothetical protein JG688_00005465 [Phytophthora aleatoria]|uniref:SWIM-type domain-containing protein n=1 Tax=Phytophthora aleatoria TaxID=2496075 RepID=A0A8J5J229_9STRA|nr:hypothetical protein JG688_00005465 [Phytophthora aleatoria]